jgi:hypothetical protein
VSLHIDEVHSDVTTTPGPPAERPGDRREPPWVVEERWCEARDRLDWLTGRVCAVDFDD